MKKSLLRKIFIATVSVLLSCCLFVMQPLAATTATEWQQTYTRTVLQNATYYYGNKGWNLSFYEVNYSNRDWYCIYYDFRSLTKQQFVDYLSFGNTLGSVPSETISGLDYDLCYLWWLPINGENLDNTGSFTFRIIISGYGYYTLDSVTYRFATGSDLLKYQGVGVPAFTFYGYKDNGIVTDIGDVNFEVDSANNAIGFAVPDWWHAGVNNYYVDVTFSSDAIQEFDALGIRFYTFCNTTGAVATYINPYIILAIDPENMMIYEPDSPPDTSEPGQTTPSNPNQDVLDQIGQVGDQIAQLENTLLVPDSVEQSIFQEYESQKDHFQNEIDNGLDSMGMITLPNQDEIDFEIDQILQENPYDDSWLYAVFGGLWGNAYIMRYILLAFVFGYFGFALFGKKG